MKLFSKLNSNEYNNQLEAILENKNYNLEVKNLLLSMLYKVENGYKDYTTVKIDADSKENFMKLILKTIEEQCKEIDIATPQTQNAKPLAEENAICKIDPQRGSILVYANEQDLLYAILQMNYEYENLKQKEIGHKSKLDILLNLAIKQFLKEAISINKSEVIRDFDGWSWNNNLKSEKAININLIYQTALIAMGEKLTNKTLMENATISKIVNEKSELIKKTYVTILAQMSLENKELRNEIKNENEQSMQLLQLMDDRAKFVNYITEEKKRINREIKKIDETLNDNNLLRKEYTKRNSVLTNEKKIFSISHLADKLEKERNEKIEEIQNNNKLLEPMQFIAHKETLEKKLELFGQIINTNKNVLIELQEEFLKEFRDKIEKQNKQELLALIYQFRYYCLIPVSQTKKIKDIPELQNLMQDTINELIDNAIDKQIMVNVSNSISVCNKVLKNIFTSKIINLQEIEILIVKNNKSENDIKIRILDVKDAEITYNETIENVKLLNIRLNKRIKVFI